MINASGYTFLLYKVEDKGDKRPVKDSRSSVAAISRGEYGSRGAET